MVKVSVLIPAYNAERYIGGALRSVIAQTEHDLEILVIDDGSSDETVSLVEMAARDDGRIRLLRTLRNGGPSAARNVGIAAARGEWVALLDADDSMMPERLEALIRLGVAKNADMVADNLLLLDEGGAVPPAPMIPPGILSCEKRLGLAEFITRNVSSSRRSRVSFGFLKPIFRRAFLERDALRYDEGMRFAEDFVFYVTCLRAGASWWITPKLFYHYLVRRHSLTKVQTAQDLDRLRSHQRALLGQRDVQSAPDLESAIRRHLHVVDRDYYYRAFTDAIKANQPAKAGCLFFESPHSVGLIAFEILHQLPTILAKAGQGGYSKRNSPHST